MPKYTIFKGSKDQQVVKTEIDRQLGPTEALVRHTHSGVCSTDLHLADRDSPLGHEGVGVVEQLGSHTSLVSDVAVGQRVGLGWNQKYCLKCRACLSGRDSICENVKETWALNNDVGAFGLSGIWDVTALRVIPDAIESKFAGPLMCAGATVWGAMQRARITSKDRVGVLGIGGLGHLAIQFLAKSGCEVIVISSSDSKHKEAVDLGADEFYTIPQIKASGKPPFQKLQHLIICSGAQPDYTLYMPLMAQGGNILPLTVDEGSTPIPLSYTIFQGINILGVKICNRIEYDDMLSFCARHHIKPTIQEYPMTADGLGRAMDALRHGKVHYRAVAVVG